MSHLDDEIERLTMHYILDEQDNPVPEPDTSKWAQWFEKADRQVAETSFGDIRVSTVFLSFPHISNSNTEDDRVMLYETMVFADDETLQKLLALSEHDDRSIISKAFGGTDIQKRYATRDEALKGHQQMCTFIEVCMMNGWIQVQQREEE